MSIELVRIKRSLIFCMFSELFIRGYLISFHVEDIQFDSKSEAKLLLNMLILYKFHKKRIRNISQEFQHYFKVKQFEYAWNTHHISIGNL